MEARKDSAFLFDLDGTLIDSVYQHVIAWREALEAVGVSLAIWKIHRRAGALGIGLPSGGYGREELVHAGAFRVYEDPGHMLAHLDEVGVRRAD